MTCNALPFPIYFFCWAIPPNPILGVTMFHFTIPSVTNFAPNGREPLRSFAIGIEYIPRSQDRLAGYSVSYCNLATSEIFFTQTVVSGVQAQEFATVLYHALWLHD